jgi:hypothetical protein
MVEVRRSEGGQEDDLLSQRPAKYRPHRPHPNLYAGLQDFLAVGITVGDRPSEESYRAPRQYRPRIDRLEMSRLVGLSRPR